MADFGSVAQASHTGPVTRLASHLGVKCGLLLTATCAALAIICSPQAGARQVLDHIVAVVGEGVVLQSDLEAAVEQLRQRMGAPAARMPEAVLRSRVLDQLVLRELQLQRARQAGLQVTDAELQQAIDRLAARNNMDTAAFLATLRAQGAPMAEMRSQLHDQLLIDKLRHQQVMGRIVVTDADVDRYLESQALRVHEDREYHIQHVLIALDSKADEQAVAAARRRIEALRQQALAGASFSELAIAHSDAGDALDGGDLGWRRGGALPTLFSEVVPKLEKGQVSEVFRGESGFHLIKLVGIRDAASAPSTDKAVVQEVQMREILLELNEIRDAARAKAQLEEIRTRVRAGGDFADLARENSDARTASQGGDLGWVRMDQVPPALAQQLQQLGPHDISEPFATPAGWQIVQVLDRRTRDLSEEHRRQRARQAIGQRKLVQEGQTWLRALRDEAYVEIRLEGYVGEDAQG